LEDPPTLAQLKAQFRKLALKLHPDIAGENNTSAFIKLQDAYNVLEPLVKEIDTLGTGTLVRTIQGYLISTLGKGLTPRGPKCDKCGGRGYVDSTENILIDYKACDCEYGFIQKWGFRPVKCADCKGTGKFTLRSGAIVPCRKCEGTGIFKLKIRTGLDICPKCHGYYEHTPIYKTVPAFSKCSVCNGTGEIYVFNPVIPIGSLSGIK